MHQMLDEAYSILPTVHEVIFDSFRKDPAYTFIDFHNFFGLHVYFECKRVHMNLFFSNYLTRTIITPSLYTF